jgi:Fic family protein
VIMLSKREIAFLNESNKIENLGMLRYSVESKNGHAQAWIQVREKAVQRERLELEDICNSQRYLMEEQASVGEDVEERLWGALRSPENRIGVRVGQYHAPSFVEVPILMERYIAQLHAELEHPQERHIDFAARAHRNFETIHPFADGNGRTGRLIANYVLLYADLPPLVFTAADRRKYYDACKTVGAMQAYFREKMQESAVCLSCDDDFVPLKRRATAGAEYDCKTCDAHFTLDWDKIFEEGYPLNP